MADRHHLKDRKSSLRCGSYCDVICDASEMEICSSSQVIKPSDIDCADVG